MLEQMERNDYILECFLTQHQRYFAHIHYNIKDGLNTTSY